MSVLTKLAAEAYDRTAFASFEAQKDFSLANAKALMWLSQLAYETDEPGKVTTLLGAWGLRLLQDGIISAPATAPLPMARTEALVVERDNAAFVAFAGTDPIVLADWVADFDIRPHLGSTEGFSLALRDTMPQIRDVLKRVSKPVFVTGHSLGGALAALAAQDAVRSCVRCQPGRGDLPPSPWRGHRADRCTIVSWVQACGTAAVLRIWSAL